MSRKVIAIRGAVSIESVDGKDQMDAVVNLVDTIVVKNTILPENIISIQFTQTPDLVQTNAAAALRTGNPVYNSIPLITSQEAQITGMPERIVRVLITCMGNAPGIPVYLGSAKNLRPDLEIGVAAN